MECKVPEFPKVFTNFFFEFLNTIRISMVLQTISPETTISPPGQTIVSNRTLDAETEPTRRHLDVIVELVLVVELRFTL